MPLAIIFAVLIYVSFELARFLTMKAQTHNVFKILWQALRYSFKHPLQVLGLYGLGFGLVLIIHLI